MNLKLGVKNDYHDEYIYAKDTQVTISELILTSHSNFSKKIHGGYILSLLDQIAFACASKFSRTYCVTASVDTVGFLNPIEVGELVTMRASINYAGNISKVIGIRVEAENIRTGVLKKNIVTHLILQWLQKTKITIV